MKKNIITDMLIPKYVLRFSCIGADCEENCCAAGWRIDIDKKSFLYYQSSLDPEFRPLFAKLVVRNPKSDTPANYGRMELVKDACRHCGFLSEAKQCRIQERLGEDALSDTCATYPRNVFRFGDLYQMTLSLSCPEASRLALLEEDAFDFIDMEQTARSGNVLVVEPKFGVPLSVMDDVRISIIQILRTPELDLSIRMKVIGVLCNRLTALLQAKQSELIPELLQDIDAAIEADSGLASLADMKKRPEVQAQMSSTLFEFRRDGVPTAHLRRVVDLVAKGLGQVEDAVPEPSVLLQNYEVGLARLAPALAAVPWLFEHFLLNEALTEVFPWKGKHPQEHYATLITRFAILRVMLAGRAAAQEAPLTPVELAETVQVFSRLYTHSGSFRDNLSKAMADSGLDHLEKLFLLL